jgi:hypothetical protein
MQQLIYLASPYSNPDKSIREENFRKVSRIAAHLVSQGNVVVSPITYGHTLLEFKEMPGDWQFWSNFCSVILYKCDKLIVYKMEGWDKSKGVEEEISIARDHGIPVEYLEYNENI